MHRVRVPESDGSVLSKGEPVKSRYSLTYFVASDPEAMIETFPACIDEEHPTKYKPMTTAEYHKMRFAEYIDQAEGDA